MNKKYIFILLLVLLIVIGSLYVLNTNLPLHLTFQNIQYVPAKCITSSSVTIKKIGQTSNGIDVFNDESIPDDKKGTGILIKRSDGNYQCYMKQ
jgi:hypothetical protein